MHSFYICFYSRLVLCYGLACRVRSGYFCWRSICALAIENRVTIPNQLALPKDICFGTCLICYKVQLIAGVGR